MFYNTINEKGAELKKSNEITGNQEDLVMWLFKMNPDESYTPFEVHHHVSSSDTPVTSIRRAMSDLTKQGKLVKLSKKKQGEYGKMNYCWQLNADRQGELF